MSSFVARYREKIHGTLVCLDRILLSGTIRSISYSRGIQSFLYQHNILFKDYPHFAEKLRNDLKQHFEQIAKAEGFEIEYIRSSKAFRKEERVQEIIEQKNITAGIVHIFSATEACSTYRYEFSKNTGKSSLRGDMSKCLHYYIYFLHPTFGLCHLRIPTWAPFRLQFYCNGHNWLARNLQKEGIGYHQLNNTFSRIDNWERAQEIANNFPIEDLHVELNNLVEKFCPYTSTFSDPYYWSLTQVECSTDIVFKKQEELAPLYDALVHAAIYTVKPDDVATFLVRKLEPQYKDEVGNNFHTRIEGTRIKHHMGEASIKMYDKQKLILRIETTANDVSFFRHYRTVEHRDGTSEQKIAPMKKTLFNLNTLQGIMKACNERYLSFLSALADPTIGVKKVEKLSAPVENNNRSYRGFNLFASEDLIVFRTILRGEVSLGSLKNGWLQKMLPGHNGAQISRILKRLHLHGLIKKIGHTYRYHLTAFGREVTTAALKLKELVVIPLLSGFVVE